MRRSRLAGCAGVIWIGLVSIGAGQAAVPKIPEHLRALIGSLDDLNPQKRADAEQRLLNIGEPARAAVRLSLQGASAQARPLMDRILLHIRWVNLDDAELIQQYFMGYADMDAPARCERLSQAASMKGAAEDVMSRVLLNDPSAAVRWVAADGLLRLMDQDADAGKELAAIVDGDPVKPVMYLPVNQNAPLLAVAGWYFRNSQPRRAEDFMRQSLELERQNPAAFLGQTDFVFQWLIDRADTHRHWVDEIQLLRQQASRTAWSPDLIPDAVSGLIATQAEHGPIDGFNQDLRTYRDYLGHPQLIYALGKLVEREGHPHLAQVLDWTALLMSGRSVDNHLIVGMFLAQREWNDAAEREYLWSLKLSGGKYPYIYFRLSMLANMRNDDLAAAQYMELGLQQSTQISGSLDDAWAEVHWHYLRAARDSNDAAAVKLHLDKLISMNADANVIHSNPSIAADVVPALQDAGRVELADKIFDQAYADLLELVKKSPEDAMAKNNLAWLCACAGKKLEEGKKLADQAVADLPFDAACLDTQAEIYWRLADAPRAVEIEVGALKIKPGDSYMTRQLAKFRKAIKPAH